MRIIEKMQTEIKTSKWLIDSRRNGTLVIDNSFQRNFVWSKKDQIKLIETILLGYSIPEIYLYNVSVDPNTGEMITSIIDGQQRIGSITDFINDEFMLSERYLSNSDVSFANKYFRDLSTDEKKTIWSYPFTSRVINTEISREYIVELFLRLNATDKTLNPQELRNAEFNGEFINQAERISDLEFWKYIFSASKTRRMADIEFISQILVYFRFGIESELNQEAINKAYDMFNEKYDKKEEDYLRFTKIISVLQEFIEIPSVYQFMKKVTHLYTLIIVVDYFLSKKPEYIRSVDFKIKLTTFSSAIIYNCTVDLNEIQLSLVSEYMKLALEGTKRKNNRIKRTNIIKKFLA
ncbi:DUF262 domain-containing protein [Alkaliphilus sp. B6464]|uniref:DUF262 domain-containing protein n=1 Tax=Alkaliphilus sp. B6464 TaxID=2731219 RepID=UPI001BABC718|nr:DUF262 domain-containing protein [Alkaliphilus sp. B6464]QUH19267.1 DUF262 domain-containing protein [Alkaliphilus sp. B6464]